VNNQGATIANFWDTAIDTVYFAKIKLFQCSFDPTLDTLPIDRAHSIVRFAHKRLSRAMSAARVWGKISGGE
jgi:hypothetical protein